MGILPARRSFAYGGYFPLACNQRSGIDTVATADGSVHMGGWKL
jgi:hypothetical protein